MNAALAALVRQNWFLLTLICALAVGMAFPEWSGGIGSAIPKNAIIAVVLFLMALPLSFDAISRTFRRPGPALLAVLVNTVAVPVIAWPFSYVLREDLAIGLIIAAAVPCTIASATVWTRLAGGNEAVSMLVTVVTNLGCFLITPAWIWLLLGRESETKSFTEMALELLMLVVLPIVVAQVVHQNCSVARFALKTKPILSTVAQLGLLSIVFLGASHCGKQLAQLDGRFGSVTGQIAAMLAIVAAVHTIAWYLGFAASQRLGFPKADGLAVAFSGSQKTLMVGLAIALNFGGLAILPLVAYHIEQLVIDTVLAGQLGIKRAFIPDAPAAAEGRL